MIKSKLKIKNYKCVGENFQGFDSIFPINIIIGRNNSGKSTYLEIVELFLSDDRKDDNNTYLYSQGLNAKDLGPVFRTGSSGGGIPGDHWEYGQQFMNKEMTIEICKQAHSLHQFKVEINNETAESMITKVPSHMNITLREYTTKRIRAERFIRPEPDDKINIQQDGSGATTIIQQFINKVEFSSDLVKKDLLNELNEILEPDLSIEEISVQQDGDDWEIYLEESKKGKVALSKSGSGIQSVILVLIYLHLIPHLEKKSHDKYFYLFEELENNIHPALLRRMFEYIRKFAVENKSYFFITTHSNVVIDSFSSDENAQILHVKHDGINSTIKQIKAFSDRKGIIEDLDIRASDLLQSNGLIWVEGPSDKVYINHWINLFTDGKIKEDVHYQIVFYGGRLLAHLTADPEEIKNYISILKVNTNCVLVMDSDKRYKSTPLNDTKKRIIKEIKAVKGYTWVTKGREIENYIPLVSLQKVFGLKNVPKLNQYDSVFDYMNKINYKHRKKYSSNKVQFAEAAKEFITESNYIDSFDLHDQLKSVVDHIKSWNKID